MDASVLRRQASVAYLGRLLVAICLVVPATAVALAAPARADLITGVLPVTGDLTLAGDTLQGAEIQAPNGTVRIDPFLPVRVVNAAIIRAAHIVVAGTLTGDGGSTVTSGGGGAGAYDGVGCGGGGGGGSFRLGGAGGDGSATSGRGSGGVGGVAVASGPGRPGGDGGSCSGLQFSPGGRGGPGGASIQLISPDIQITGTVTVNGSSGSNGRDGSSAGPAEGGGGGGGGGEILLTGHTVLSGTLSARGGAGGFGGSALAGGAAAGGGGGGGSGGRILIDGGALTLQTGGLVDAGQAVRAPGGLAGIGGTAGAGALGGLGSVSTLTTTSLASSLNPSTVGQTVTFTATVTPPTATGAVSFTADGSPILGCTGVSVAGGIAACSTADLGPGTHPVAAEFTPSGTGFQGSTGTLAGGQRVNAAPDQPQAITLPAQADHVVGEPPFSLTGVAGGGSRNPVVVTSTGPCSVSGLTVTLADVGMCMLTADQAGGNGYLAAPSVSRSFAISYGQRVLALSATGRRGGLVAVVLRLTDAGGSNLSSAAVQVRATAIDGGPLGAVLTPDPTNNFPYSPLLGSYTFAEYVRSGLARGQHTLTFTAGADPRPHTIAFTTV